MTALDIIIMAAGKGTRMKSRIPKVLQRLAGRPLLGHVLAQAQSLRARRTVVVTGHGADAVEAYVATRAAADGLVASTMPRRSTGTTGVKSRTVSKGIEA